jgi:hypothetical protein
VQYKFGGEAVVEAVRTHGNNSQWRISEMFVFVCVVAALFPETGL